MIAQPQVGPLVSALQRPRQYKCMEVPQVLHYKKFLIMSLGRLKVNLYEPFNMEPNSDPKGKTAGRMVSEWPGAGGRMLFEVWVQISAPLFTNISYALWTASFSGK